MDHPPPATRRFRRTLWLGAAVWVALMAALVCWLWQALPRWAPVAVAECSPWAGPMLRAKLAAPDDVAVDDAIHRHLLQPGLARLTAGLRAALTDPDPSMRALAAAWLGEAKDPQASQPLTAALADADPAVRRAAAGSLAAVPDRAAVAPLIALIADRGSDAATIDNAAAAIASCGDRLAADPLLALLGQVDGERRLACLFALRRLGDARALEPLLAMLTAGDTRLRRGAAWNVGFLHDARAVGPLIATLADADGKVALYSAFSLGEIGDGRALMPLLAYVERTRAPLDRQGLKNALRAIRRLRDPTALDALIRLLDHPDAVLRTLCVNELVEVKDPRAVSALIHALADADDNVYYAVESQLQSRRLSPEEQQRVAAAMRRQRGAKPRAAPEDPPAASAPPDR